MGKNSITYRSDCEVLSERIKTRDEYALDDKREAKRLFRQLIGIMNRCDDPAAKKTGEKLISLLPSLDKIDFSRFRRRYNYITSRRKREDDATFNDGFNACLDQMEEDGWFGDKEINENKMNRIQRLTEEDLHNMVKEAVVRLRESYYGFDESSFGFDEADEKGEGGTKKSPDDGRPRDSHSKTSQQRREVVLDSLRNEPDDPSNVKRREFIFKLYGNKIKNDDDYDTYRSLFSKCLNPDDSAHQFDDSQINTMYNMLSSVASTTR